MALIAAIAFPSIAKLQEENKNERYQAYEKVMRHGAKVYIDQYGEDILNGKTCVVLTKQKLISEDLIKEYKHSNELLEGKVKIENHEGNYTYQVYVEVRKKNQKIYETNKNSSITIENFGSNCQMVS